MKGVKIGRIVINIEQLTMIICTIVIFFAQISVNNHSNAIMLIGYCIALFWAFVNDSSILMAMNLFLLSDNSILDVGGISIQLLFMCIYLIRFSLFKRGAVYQKTFLAGLLIVVYSIIYIDLGVGYVLQGLKLAVMLIYMTEYLSEEGSMTRINYEKQLSFAVMGVFLSVVVAICVNPAMLLSARIALSGDSNWNLLGILSALLFSHSFMMFFVEKTNGNKYIFYSVLMAVCALISTSRTALLVAAIGVIWALLFINKHSTILRKGIILLGIVLILVLIANGTIQISFVNKLLDRIINPRRGDISNGRFTLWAGYIDYLRTHKNIMWFGYGKTLIEGIRTTTSMTSNMAHNMFIEQLTMYGIVGTVIVTILYLTSIKRIIKKAHSKDIVLKKKYIVGILLVFVSGMFSHIITSVLVTTELYLGLMQYVTLSIKKEYENE